MSNDPLKLKVFIGYARSAHAGAGGMFQINTVINSESGANLTSQVDVGRHFSEPEYGEDDFESESELKRYLKHVFGPNIKEEVIAED